MISKAFPILLFFGVLSFSLCLRPLSYKYMLLNAGSCPRRTVRPNTLKCQSLEQRKVYCRAVQGDRWLMPPNPELPKGFQQSIFKGKVREGCGLLLQISWFWNPLFLQPSTQVRSHIPVNLQQDKCYSLFCNFLSLYEWKSVIPLKVRALRVGYPVYFRLYATFLHGSKSNGKQRLK